MNIDEIIGRTLEALREGGVILYPTDTIWGLGCDACNEKAVEKIYRIKQRAESKSLVLLAADMDMVARYIREIPAMAVDLVEVNDAPMTIIYPGAQSLAPNVVAEDGSVGIRIPIDREEQTAANGGGAFCREILRKFRRPIVSTSANISGEPSPKSYDDISEELLSAVDYVVPKALGRGSTGRASQIIKLGLRGEVEILRA